MPYIMLEPTVDPFGVHRTMGLASLAPGNGDGEISAEDFYTIMTKKTFP